MSEANPAKPRRVHKPAEERRREILEAATRLFAEHGFPAADTQAMADAAGVGKGTVYRHFPTKEVLFTETLRHNLDALTAAMESARKAEEDPLAQLKAGMRAYIEFFERNPELIELLVQERAEFRTRSECSLYFSYVLSGRKEWEQMFARIAEHYRLRPQALEEWMEVCGDLMHGAMVLSRSPLPRRPLSERFEAVFDIYLHGILEP